MVQSNAPEQSYIMRYLEVGQTVEMHNTFVVTGYDANKHLIDILIQYKSGTVIGDFAGNTATMPWMVPIYLSKLGLHIPAYDYIIPGPYLDTNDPLYLEDASEGHYKINDEIYKLNLDKDFPLTGKYYLHPVGWGNIITKTSRLRTQEERESVLMSIINNRFDGSVIKGTLIRMFMRPKDGGDIKETAYFPLIRHDLSSLNRYDLADMIGVIHDDITNIEYEIPLFTIKESTY